ncbi:MAG: tetratricopeptide repeat protein [Bacteroidales bacterium]|jgi:tetratricopeptide (TPR) repeat protein|nr:tetratricopeptide repeat protein [Bacteroidales bacterium]
MNKYIVLFFICSFFLISCKNDKNSTTDNNENKIKVDSINSIEEITKKIRENPLNADLFLLRSELYLTDLNIEEALNDAEIALRIDSLRPDIYLKIADYNLLLGKSEEAKDILIKSVRFFPDNIEIRLKLAYIYFYVQMYIDAMKELNYIEARNIQNSESFYLKALIFDEMEMYNDAITALKTAVEYDNSNWKAYNLIGLIYGSLDNKLAVEYFRTAVKLFPNNLEIRYNAGVVFQKFELYDEAIAEYEYVITADPKTTEAYYNLGIIYVDNKNFMSALENFTKAIEADSLSYRSYYNRGYTYEQLKNYKLAENDYRQSLKIMPNYELAIEGLNEVIEKKQ